MEDKFGIRNPSFSELSAAQLENALDLMQGVDFVAMWDNILQNRMQFQSVQPVTDAVFDQFTQNVKNFFGGRRKKNRPPQARVYTYEEKMDILQTGFEETDANQDRLVTFDELVAYFTARQAPFDPELMATDLMPSYDSNNDGVIDGNEFFTRGLLMWD